MKRLRYLKYLFSALFAMMVFTATGQGNIVQRQADSLLKIIENTSGHEKVTQLMKLASLYLSKSPEEVIQYAKEAYKEAIKQNYSKGKAEALNRIGSGFYINSMYDSALIYYNMSLYTCQKIDYQEGIAKAYSNIGLIYDCLGTYNKALDYHMKSLDIERELGNKKGISGSLNNIGNIYYFIENYDKALEYFQKALEINIEIQNSHGIAQNYNNIGIIYQIKKEYDNAITYFHSSLAFNKKLNNPIDLAACYNNIGNVYMDMKDYNAALHSYKESIKISKNYNDLWSLANTLRNLGGIYLDKKEFAKAEEKFTKSLEYAKKISAKEIISNTYRSLANLYAKQNNYKKAFDYYKKYTLIHDSLFSTETSESIKNLEIGYELQKKDREIELLQKNEEISKLKNQRKTRTIYLTLALLIIALILMLFIMYRYSTKSKTNKLLEEKNSEINRINNELKNFNEKLEQKVQYRTKNLKEEIKEREKIDVELKKALKNAEDANYLKNAFLTNMSHEIRTPLNGIIGFSSLLETELSLMENQELYEYASGIQQSGERLLHLLNNIIDISRVEANDMDITITPCVVNEIIKNTAELYSFKANDKGIKFNSKLNDIPKALADEPKLTKIISDIIDNAIKYTEKGFINVVSGYDEESNKVKIIIKDTGIGIDKSYLDHIFEAFRQESLGYSRTYQGAGLGLPLAKRILDLMNGEIQVESVKGSGTIVTILLTSDIKKEEEESEPEVRIMEKKPAQPVEDLKIFVVEDDRMNRLVINKMLKKVAEVTSAVDGDETMKIIRENSKKGITFDIMLFDINLPSPWDGIKLMKEIKKNFKEYINIPFIAQTAYAMTGDKERLLEAGFDNYLAKPINKNELINMIYNQLRININK